MLEGILTTLGAAPPKQQNDSVFDFVQTHFEYLFDENGGNILEQPIAEWPHNEVDMFVTASKANFLLAQFGYAKALTIIKSWFDDCDLGEYRQWHNPVYTAETLCNYYFESIMERALAEADNRSAYRNAHEYAEPAFAEAVLDRALKRIEVHRAAERERAGGL